MLQLVHKQPGITLAELAKRMKIQPNYLYRILPHLEKDGKVTKRDKGYHARKLNPRGTEPPTRVGRPVGGDRLALAVRRAVEWYALGYEATGQLTRRSGGSTRRNFGASLSEGCVARCSTF